MGICSSCESTSVATAKLISHDGRLHEFSYPVKVSYVLRTNPSSFICNSDEMDFDDVVSAISDDEELQLGQLYFALPLSRLRRPLQPEEMAALAVKASSALAACRRKNVSLFTDGHVSCQGFGSGRGCGSFLHERRWRWSKEKELCGNVECHTGIDEVLCCFGF